jgi:hypothetical protein
MATAAAAAEKKTRNRRWTQMNADKKAGKPATEEHG